MEVQKVVKTEFKFRGAAAKVMKKLAAANNNLTIQAIATPDGFRYVIIRKVPK